MCGLITQTNDSWNIQLNGMTCDTSSTSNLGSAEHVPCFMCPWIKGLTMSSQTKEINETCKKQLCFKQELDTKIGVKKHLVAMKAIVIAACTAHISA